MIPFKRRLWLVPMGSALCVLALFPKPAFSQVSEVETLKKVVQQIQQQLQKALARIDQLEKEKSSDTARVERTEQSIQSLSSAPSALNPSIGLVLDSTVSQQQHVGGNFNFRSAELGLSASVDPFARMYSFMTGSNEGFEVEEAAAVTTSLPWNLTARGGRFFADFGRLPKVHPHEYAFVNTPLSIQRMVGGETQADGVEVHYLFPTPFFLRATMGGYNKMGADNDSVSNSSARSWSRFTYLGRLNTYADITDNQSIEVGSSLAYTPALRLEDGSRGDRSLAGIDLTYRYQPLSSSVYQGVTWGSEFYANSQRVFFDSSMSAHREESYGGYSYAELKLNKSWSTGFLFDYAPSIESPGKKTKSYSPFLTWNISEFNRLRLQYTYGDDQVHEDPSQQGNQVFLQWTTVIGAHTHGFRGR